MRSAEVGFHDRKSFLDPFQYLSVALSIGSIFIFVVVEVYELAFNHDRCTWGLTKDLWRQTMNKYQRRSISRRNLQVEETGEELLPLKNQEQKKVDLEAEDITKHQKKNEEV